ncbi:MAG: FG-GAP-like repeat-containing protein [Patescibacteria group bacterium]|jgi:hypothetical protein
MRPSTFLEQTETKQKTTVHPVLALFIVAFWAGSALSALVVASNNGFNPPQNIITSVEAAALDDTNSIYLAWTAPGDDANTGQAASYDIRYSTATITESNWALATQAPNVGSPKTAGSPESLQVAQLQPNQAYYFALKTTDDAGNVSSLSNIATKKTASISLPNCVENWHCTEWLTCQNNQQLRTCTDQTGCGTETNKPAETRICSKNTGDSIPPNTYITAAPTVDLNSARFSFTWQGLDDTTKPEKLVFSYKLDSQAWSSWTAIKRVTYQDLTDGKHTFKVRSQDEAGNIDPSPAEAEFQVALTIFIVVGPEGKNEPRVTLLNKNGGLIKSFLAYEKTFRGGIQVKLKDLGEDGLGEIIVAPGSGRKAEIRIFRKDGSRLATFLPYGDKYKDGVNIAVGDVNADGKAEIITAKQKGSPNVRIYGFKNGRYTQILKEFNAESTSFKNGIALAVGDVNADGKAEILTAPFNNGSPTVKVFQLNTKKVFKQISQKTKIYASGLRTGYALAVGDLNNDGKAEVIIGPRASFGPQVKILKFLGLNTLQLQKQSFYAFTKTDKTGVRLSTGDINNDGKAEILVSRAGNSQPNLLVFSSTTLKKLKTILTLSASMRTSISHDSGT